MSEYAKKTCYDCGIREPANRMERVTESYTSGQSNTKVTAGNLVFGAMGDKRGQNAVGRAIKGNNRRSYTRNRTVWKCLDCSGHNADVANAKATEELKASGEIRWSEDACIYGIAAGTVVLLAWLVGVVFDWGVGWFDFSSAYMWITGLGGAFLFGYFNGEEEKLKKAIADRVQGD